MFKLSEMFGQRGGLDAFGWKAVKNIGIRTVIGRAFAETGTTSPLTMGSVAATHPSVSFPSTDNG